MWRCTPQAGMVMKMKRSSTLDTSVKKSEAKLDPRACDSLVGGTATSALMKLIPPPISHANSNDSLVFFTKNIASKTSKTVTQSRIRSQSKPYSHPPTNLRPIYNDTCKEPGGSPKVRFG